MFAIFRKTCEKSVRAYFAETTSKPANLLVSHIKTGLFASDTATFGFGVSPPLRQLHTVKKKRFYKTASVVQNNGVFEINLGNNFAGVRIN